jgi:hypothetical protein
MLTLMSFRVAEEKGEVDSSSCCCCMPDMDPDGNTRRRRGSERSPSVSVPTMLHYNRAASEYCSSLYVLRACATQRASSTTPSQATWTNHSVGKPQRCDGQEQETPSHYCIVHIILNWTERSPTTCFTTGHTHEYWTCIRAPIDPESLKYTRFTTYMSNIHHRRT